MGKRVVFVLGSHFTKSGQNFAKHCSMFFENNMSENDLCTIFPFSLSFLTAYRFLFAQLRTTTLSFVRDCVELLVSLLLTCVLKCLDQNSVPSKVTSRVFGFSLLFRSFSFVFAKSCIQLKSWKIFPILHQTFRFYEIYLLCLVS